MTAKSRTVSVRLISMAMTGYFKTFVRPRTHRPLSMIKYDPVGKTTRPFQHLDLTLYDMSFNGREKATGGYGSNYVDGWSDGSQKLT